MLQLVTEIFSTKIADRIVKLRRKLNCYQRISSLPLEVLVNIFKYTMSAPYIDVRTYFSQLCILAQVSHDWAIVVKGTPKLWTRVDSSCLVSAAAPSLSRGLPLTVSLDSPGGSPLWTRALSLVERWESALVTCNSREVLTTLEKHSAPLLLDLNLELIPEFRDQEVKPLAMDLFAGHAPKLRRLRLVEVILFNGDPTILRGIHKLSLHYAQGVPSLTQLSVMLRGCPELEELALTLGASRNLSVPATVHISLPHLRRHVLQITDPAAANFLLSCISTVRLLYRLPIQSQRSRAALASRDAQKIPFVFYDRQQFLHTSRKRFRTQQPNHENDGCDALSLWVQSLQPVRLPRPSGRTRPRCRCKPLTTHLSKSPSTHWTTKILTTLSRCCGGYHRSFQSTSSCIRIIPHTASSSKR